MDEQKVATYIEGLVDSHGMSHVVGLLIDVCVGKADHIRANWQDNVTATAWDDVADGLMKVQRDNRIGT